MRIKDTEIPQAAVDAGRAAMVDGFKAHQVQAAVSVALRADPGFSYPPSHRKGADDCLDLRVADSLIQSARRSGAISFVKGRWAVN